MVKCDTYPTKEAWLQARTSYIGGTDAACILGVNPYKSNTECWDEKKWLLIPEDISEKPAVKYGIEAEPLLRRLFAMDYPELDVLYLENNMWTNDNYPWAHASLDGWITAPDGRRGIFENKTATIQRHEQWNQWTGRIPNHYYCQILHYLMVTEFDFAKLNAAIRYEKDGEIYETIRRYHIERSDVEADIEYLAQAEKEFADSLRTGVRPAAILPQI